MAGDSARSKELHSTPHDKHALRRRYWQVRPVRELDASANDKHFFASDSRRAQAMTATSGRWHVYSGGSFNIWMS